MKRCLSAKDATRCRRAFTLVEMLVTVAIIAVVASLGFYLFRAGQEAVDSITGDVVDGENSVRNRKWGLKARRVLPIPGQYIVMFHSNVFNAQAEAARIASRVPMQIKTVYDAPGFKGFFAYVEEQLLPAIQQDPAVSYVEQNKSWPLCQCTCTQAGLASTECISPELQLIGFDLNYNGTAGISDRTVQNFPYQPRNINALIPNLWSSVGVALLDSGVNENHVDFTAPDPGLVTPTSNNTSNIFVYRFGPSPNNPRDGHGTNMAGVIAALRNGIGVHGVCPGVRMYNYRITNLVGSTETGTTALFSSAVTDVINNAANIHVAVMGISPFEGFVATDYLASTANQNTVLNGINSMVSANITVVVPAGNGTGGAQIPAGGSGSSTFGSITAAFLDSSNLQRIDVNSRFGGNNSMAAPGEDICTTTGGGSNYTQVSGTSFAAAHIGGVVARFHHFTLANKFPRNINFNSPSFPPNSDNWQSGQRPVPRDVVRIIRNVMSTSRTSGGVLGYGNNVPILNGSML